MNSGLLYLSFFAIAQSYLCSLRAFSPGGIKILRKFSFFLLFTLVGELFGMAWPKKIYLYTTFSRSNQWFYNFFHLFGYAFLLYFFYTILYLEKVRRIIIVLSAAYLLFAVINLAFFQGPKQLNTYTEMVACFVMVFLSLAYYYQLLQAKQVISLKNDPFFWISTGILIYHLGSVMGIFLINVMNTISTERAQSIHMIIRVSAIAMYINFSIAYLCRKMK